MSFDHEIMKTKDELANEREVGEILEGGCFGLGLCGTRDDLKMCHIF